MLGARIFVAISFVLLGASFIASTALLVREFESLDWFTMVVAHSHLFFFFPVLGLLALCAFFLPSVVLTHLYWNHLRYGTGPFPRRARRGAGGVLRVCEVSRQAAALDLRGLAQRACWPTRATGEGAWRSSTRWPTCGQRHRRASGVSSFARTCASDPLARGAGGDG